MQCVRRWPVPWATINAIENDARLDVEWLQLHTIEVPKAAGNFAELLAGRGFAKMNSVFHGDINQCVITLD